MSVAVWPLLVYGVTAAVLVASMIGISYVLGERHHGRATAQAYESGITATGSAHLRFAVKFYLVAMFFVVFDVEAMFLFAWAIAWNEAGWTGYAAVVVFTAIMVAALVYLARCGALDWGTDHNIKNQRSKIKIAESGGAGRVS